VHLNTDHAAAQFVERLAWAIDDAENAEHEHRIRPRPSQRGRSATRPGIRSRVHA
jgi:hypothetical protein